jgi:SAM-dependent methyltransferase
MRSAANTWSSQADWLLEASEWHRRDAAAAAVEPLCGICDICGVERTFSGLVGPALRESLLCQTCGNNSRQRAAAAVLLAALSQPQHAHVYCTEQASAFYLGLRRRLGHLRGSEYVSGIYQRLRLSAWLLWRHRIPEMVHHQDVMALNFADACLDGIVSLDVLEHVHDYRLALREFARVLRPGGVLVLTVPFYENLAESDQIAWLDAGGAVQHQGIPEYHGDPLSGGVLCFHHFGWDLLVAMRQAGFAEASACRIQDSTRGLPQGQWVLRAWR